jgi:hypothetical protein
MRARVALHPTNFASTTRSQRFPIGVYPPALAGPHTAWPQIEGARVRHAARRELV